MSSALAVKDRKGVGPVGTRAGGFLLKTEDRAGCMLAAATGRAGRLCAESKESSGWSLRMRSEAGGGVGGDWL